MLHRRKPLPRRKFLRGLGALPLVATVRRAGAVSANRVRPGDPAWPSRQDWQALNRATNGRLVEVPSPLSACSSDPEAASCRELFRSLKNPYAIGDDVSLTQTSGWVDAWTAQPSAFAVEAETEADVAAAVSFAREHNLRLVIKGGGHSYLGTSNAPDSLLIWTRRMDRIVVNDAFVPIGCEGRLAPQPAVTVGAGAVWMHVYDAVTTKAGRYVQGGGCGTVGVAGLVQGGGFGSYSKTFGTAGASLLEARIVGADGSVKIANPATNPELFWALKGGGGGSFGVVTEMTLRTHPLPDSFGVVIAVIQASSDAAFQRLVGRFVGFYADTLITARWGEIAKVRPGNTLIISMEAHGFDQPQAAAIWRPFFQWVADSPGDFSLRQPPRVLAAPARNRWDPVFLRERAPDAVGFDDRPGASADNMFWTANLSETGHFIHGFESVWLPAALLAPDRRASLVDALVAASRIWTVEVHFQKGLAGAPADAVAATADTPMNPAVLSAFALAIIAGEGPPAFPGLRGHEPDLPGARRNATKIRQATPELSRVAPDPGAYLAESSFFQSDWQQAYWGSNYPRLLNVKRKYDPDGLFFARHGVGSEDWSEDGFTRLSNL